MSEPMSERVIHPSAVLWRIVAAVGGGYAFCWGFIALTTASLFALGMAFHDAEILSAMLGLLLYVTCFIWAFSAPSVLRVSLVLFGGAGLMTVAASLIQHLLVS